MSLTLSIPYEHQARIIEQTKNHRYAALFMEQGTGKTMVTLATMTHLFREGRINGALILAPNGVHDNWAINEIPKHCPLSKKEMTVLTWHAGMGNKDFRLFSWIIENTPLPCLLVILANVEAVRSDFFLKTVLPFLKNRKYLAVMDESTTIKNPRAAQSKRAVILARNAAYTRILTGTPVTQGPLDLWMQCKFLDENALPFPSWTAFKTQFAKEQLIRMGGRAFNKIIGYQNLDQLTAHLDKFSVRILKSECLDLPPKVYQNRYIELTASQQHAYQKLAKECILLLEDTLITVTEVITMMLRLHQITLGYITNDDGTLVSIPHNRTAQLLAQLDETQGQVIVFCRFREDCRQITEAILASGRRIVQYHGGIDDKGRSLAIRAFQEEGVDVFVATRAAARGLTLTAAEHVIYYSQGFSLEDRLQSEDRAHRIGQTRTVVYTDYIARGTIDEKVITALQAKKQVADLVVDKKDLVSLVGDEVTSL